jgi:hypothetical protein
MIILPHFLAVVVMMFQIFSCFVKNVIEVNQIVVLAKYIIELWGLIVVIEAYLEIDHLHQQAENQQALHRNALEQQKRVPDVEIEQAVLMAVVIYMISL